MADLSTVDLVSLGLGAAGVVISLASFLFTKKTEQGKALKEEFDPLKARVDAIAKQVNEVAPKADVAALDTRVREVEGKSKVLEERINKEIELSSKFQDRIADKIEDVAREVYQWPKKA